MRVVWQTLALLGKFATSYVGLVLLSLLVITVSMNALASAQTRWGLLRLVQFSQSTFAPEALADYSALTEVRSMVVRFEGGAETLREAVTSLSSMIPAVSARLIEELRRDDVARASAAIESAFGLSVDTARAAAAQALGASGLDALRSRAATPKPAGSGSAGSGAPGLRQAIGGKYQRFYGMGVDPEREVTVCCGATEAMLATLMATVNPGDEVIVIAPFYENYWPDTVLAGATPRFVHLREPVLVLDPQDAKDGWRLDLDELAAAFNERTAAIVINTPNNPTGKVLSKVELEVIAGLCQRWGALAITDEIYEHIIYGGRHARAHRDD